MRLVHLASQKPFNFSLYMYQSKKGRGLGKETHRHHSEIRRPRLPWVEDSPHHPNLMSA